MNNYDQVSLFCRCRLKPDTDVFVPGAQTPLGGGLDDCGESRDCSPTITWPRSKRGRCTAQGWWKRGRRGGEEEEEPSWRGGTRCEIPPGENLPLLPSVTVGECDSQLRRQTKRLAGLHSEALLSRLLETPRGLPSLQSPWFKNKLFIVFKAFIFLVPSTVVYNLQRI